MVAVGKPATSPRPILSSLHCHLEYKEEEENAEHMRSETLAIFALIYFFSFVSASVTNLKFSLRVANLGIKSLRVISLKVTNFKVPSLKSISLTVACLRVECICEPLEWSTTLRDHF